MRVVAGEVRGFELRAPEGHETRPTSDKVRDAIFNVLAAEVVDASVLDLYAGSGAMAIEALSRGAASADLVESRPTACAVIRANLTKTHFEARSRVWCEPVSRFLSSVWSVYDLVTVDPPYQSPDTHRVMERLGRLGAFSPDATVALEHSKRFDAHETYGKLKRCRIKHYGDTMVSFYQRLGKEQ